MDNSPATAFAAILESLWRWLIGSMADAGIVGILDHWTLGER